MLSVTFAYPLHHAAGLIRVPRVRRRAQRLAVERNAGAFAVQALGERAGAVCDGGMFESWHPRSLFESARTVRVPATARGHFAGRESHIDTRNWG